MTFIFMLSSLVWGSIYYLILIFEFQIIMCPQPLIYPCPVPAIPSTLSGAGGTNHQVAAPPSSSVRADCWEDAGVPEVNRTTGFCRWAPLSLSVQSKLLWVGQSTACYIWCKMSTSQNWKCTWQAAAGSACLSENRTDWMPSPLSLKFRVILYEEARSTDYY